MSFLGNIIWFIFGGFAALGYIVGGLALCLTIIGIPFGMQLIRIGFSSLAPFGKEIKQTTEETTFLKIVFDVIWLLVAGWGVAVAHLSAAAVLAITVIGLPWAMQHLKLVPVALFPLHYEVG